MRAVVTGANSGIGRVAAANPTAAGHDVVLACCSVERGLEAAAAMTGTVQVRRLDLAELASVRAFADSIDQIDVLINNAGVMGLPLQRTVDGFEAHIGINHLGHFALTCALATRISDRVIYLGSAGRRVARMDLEDLNWRRRDYAMMTAYANSKLATNLFVTELAARGVRACVVEPGAAGTQIGHDADAADWARSSR